jgi:hypothetical protein
MLMGTYYDRYQSGEHEEVWTDLLALGRAIQNEPLYSDALAVARETMSRARTNIETLIVRLDQIGYRFQTARDSEFEFVERLKEIYQATTRELETRFPLLLENRNRNVWFEQLLSDFDKRLAPASTLDERSVYLRAPEWFGTAISNLERHLQAPLPLSLKAWFECIQHISFIGSHPVLNPIRQQPSTAATGEALPDPLAIMGLPDHVDYESWEMPEGYPIAVDEFAKAEINRDHCYCVNFRDSRADAIFADWQNDYFVPYLRRVFKWGGFPGWARHPDPPLKLIAELNEGLTPI